MNELQKAEKEGKDDELTVLHVVWAPRMTIYPHDHRMWAAIGIYAGQEDNSFFRRSAPEPPPTRAAATTSSTACRPSRT